MRHIISEYFKRFKITVYKSEDERLKKAKIKTVKVSCNCDAATGGAALGGWHRLLLVC